MKNSVGQERVLYALLAGAGLRAGEALGLELQHISEDFRTIFVRQSVWDGMKQDPKTRSAVRDVDLCSTLAEMLRQFVGERRTGLLFANGKGRPLAQSNVLRRSLHPLLKELETGKAGFHSFRRFRTTHLRKNRVPEDLLRFWIGHADRTITDTYRKVQEDIAFRQEVAEKAGLGFVLENPIVRSVRKKEPLLKLRLLLNLNKWEGLKWCAQGDDFRTFLADFVAALPQIDSPGVNLPSLHHL